VVITESGVASNGARFTVASGTQPTITASASPAPNVNGWNNSNVTVTFTCTAGTASITNCPSPQTITTEGANQVISGTATDANGLTATASVTLNIDKTIPVLAVTSPADGTSFSTAAVTISGTVSDALSGLSTVTCNGTAATAASGSFSCNISLNVGVNLVVVRATDVAGNVAGSNFHLSLAGTLPTPQVLQITPTKVSMLVGDTQTFTAVDELGRPRPDATWTISDITLATISTDSAPVLTAVGIGEPTLTANVQGTSAQIQVNILGGTSLTPGTYRWAAAPVAGFALYEMLQAAPASASTPDLYSIETGAGNSVLIRAFTGDGQQMWQQTLGNFSFSALPDAFGGLLVDTSAGRIDLDGASGMPVWQSPASGSTIRQDGTIVTTTNTNLSMFDGNTGQKVLDITPPRQSTFARIFTYGLPTDSGVGGPDNTGTPTVGPDGSIYLLYTTSDYTDVQSRTIVFGEPFFTDVITTIYSLNLLTVSPDGSIHTQQVGPSTTNVLPVPGYAIPDGNGGVLASWSNLPSWPFHVADVSTNGTSTYDLPLSGIFLSGGGTVVGTNAMAFATDSTNTVAFTASSGQTFWNIPGSIAEVTLGNGMSLFDAQGDIVQVDSQGVAGMPVPCATCLAAFNLNLYTTFTGPAGLVVGPSQILEVSESPLPQGNRQNQNVTPTPSFAHFITRNPGDPPSSFTTAQAVNDIKTFLSGTNTKNSFYTGGEGRTAASINNFLSVLKGGNSGLGFIGDSALASGGAGFPFSIGLCFFPSEPTDPPSIPPNCLVRTPDDLNSNPLLHYGNILQANPTWRTADKLPVNLRIVFIGSCEDADVFNQWWQIDNSTTGHVLVVPSSPTAPTNLVSAIAEWEDIVKYMAGTMNAGEAITKANQVLANQNSPGAWKPIGDPHVCISTACKKATHTN
jgi:hypothetical protein